jgi:hypothetical protein
MLPSHSQEDASQTQGRFLFAQLDTEVERRQRRESFEHGATPAAVATLRMESLRPSGAAAATSELLFTDMVARQERLSSKLTNKEREAAQLATQRLFLEKELAASRDETAAAREELHREATRWVACASYVLVHAGTPAGWWNTSTCR